jgi:hypothetical protein
MHIRTCLRQETSPDQLITDMIGRRLEGVYPTRNRQLGEVVLKAESLTSGQTFDSSVGREPLGFTVGAGQMIKGFDSAVKGMSVGQSLEIGI